MISQEVAGEITPAPYAVDVPDRYTCPLVCASKFLHIDPLRLKIATTRIPARDSPPKVLRNPALN